MGMVDVGIVGVGSFGEEHLKVFRRMDGVRVAGIVDRDTDRAHSVAERYQVNVFSTIDELMEVESLAALSIAVPATHHVGILTELAPYDCRILVEKPLSINAATAAELIRDQDPYRLMVGHILRFCRPYETLRESVGGRFGIDGTSVRVRPADHLMLYPDEHIVTLTMTHDLDAILWITGEHVEEVRATGHRTSAGQWYSVVAELSLSGGGRWKCRAHWGGAHDDSMALAGATLRITEEYSAVTEPNGAVRRFPGAAGIYEEALGRELSHFIECVRASTPSSVFDLVHAGRAVSTADAIMRSLQEGGDAVVPE